jgi:tartrate dehydrogenase/decarboxylase/D-malate dehydrogenase
MWAASMMLNHLGETEPAIALVAAFEAALAAGVRTRDLGGTASTEVHPGRAATLRACRDRVST